MSYHLRIKICGVTNEVDAREAARLGANALGLNFYPQSPRFVQPLAANYILRDLPPFTEAVGVFVNEPLRDVFLRLQTLSRIRAIQWHGQNRELSNVFP